MKNALVSKFSQELYFVWFAKFNLRNSKQIIKLFVKVVLGFYWFVQCLLLSRWNGCLSKNSICSLLRNQYFVYWENIIKVIWLFLLWWRNFVDSLLHQGQSNTQKSISGMTISFYIVLRFESSFSHKSTRFWQNLLCYSNTSTGNFLCKFQIS